MVSERIKKVRAEAGLTQSQFADKLNLKRNTIATYETGVKPPSERTLLDICRVFSINEEWMMTGKGRMYSPSKEKLSEYLGQIAKGNDDFIESIIEVYMELDETSRQALKTIAYKMAEKINNKNKDGK